MAALALSLVPLMLADRAAAQTTVTVVPIDASRQGEAGQAYLTQVAMGLRRGLRDLDGVDFVYPGELFARRDSPPELIRALEQLPLLGGVLRSNPAEAGRVVEGVLQVFEENLDLMSRSDLVDAYMVRALAACQMRRRRQCREGFDYVLTFRESEPYDFSRYPSEYESLFEERRLTLLADGERSNATILTVPSGAEVFVDGRSIGPSPAVAEQLLVGEHYVTAKALGYLEAAARVTVTADGLTTQELFLQEARRAALVEQAVPRIVEEVGEPTAGPNIESLGSVLPVNQIVFALVTPRSETALVLQTYVYDLRTKFLLASREDEISTGATVPAEVQRIAAELYDGVDRSGNVAAPEVEVPTEEFVLWEQWWFWSALAVLVGSATVAGIALQPDAPDVPPNVLRFEGVIDLMR